MNQASFKYIKCIFGQSRLRGLWLSQMYQTKFKLFIITILKNLLVNNLMNLIIPIHSTLLYQVILTGGNMINNFNHINNIPLFYGKYKFINKYNPVF